ncbi:MAG: CRISPR-associated protein Cas4, partial [Kamptonema sp. SIO4C4]|nr:CRISPR-associated protein Cas4 [Kamptonema sp. SIO4C4]
QYRLIGKADLIEAAQGEFYPVEYKRGKPGEWGNDALQVCAQALCLEEMTGKPVKRGFLYYAHSHQRETVDISAGLREEAIEILTALGELFQTGERPKPVYTSRCRGCSLYKQCLPQASKKLKTYREES